MDGPLSFQQMVREKALMLELQLDELAWQRTLAALEDRERLREPAAI